MGRRLFPTLPEDAYDTGPIREGPFILVADLRLDNRAELIADLAIPPEGAKSLSDGASAYRGGDVDGEGFGIKGFGRVGIALI